MRNPNFMAIKFESWSDLFAFGRGLSNWFFRGQSQAKWPLKSSLERAVGVDHGSPWCWQHAERWMLRKFRGFAHNYLAHPPADDDVFEWLTLMQHHGAPTRLLDCTFSFSVAAFFAAREGDTDFAVWAFNWERFWKSATERFGLKIDPMFAALDFHTATHVKANEFLTGATSGALAFPAAPRHSCERLEAQQGMFLFPCDVTRTLQENLECLIGQCNINSINDPSNLVPYSVGTHTADQFRRHWLLKLVLPGGQRFGALTDLHAMNIHEASLFPGLDGFARSLRLYTLRDDRGSHDQC